MSANFGHGVQALIAIFAKFWPPSANEISQLIKSVRYLREFTVGEYTSLAPQPKQGEVDIELST